MTNQIQGEILFKGIYSGAQPPEWVYTPWLPVHGDIAVFAIEILSISSSIMITWNAETRTLEDPTVSDLYASNQTANSVGVHVPSSLPSNAKELVRYKFATGSGADVTEWAVVRALEPSWQLDGR